MPHVLPITSTFAAGNLKGAPTGNIGQLAGRKASANKCCQPHSLIWKIGKIALAILITLSTLAIFLCFKGGRKYWADAIGNSEKPALVKRPLLTQLPAAQTILSSPLSPISSPKNRIMRIPQDAQEVLRAWYQQNEQMIKNKLAAGKRVAYNLQDIPKAFEAFKEKHQYKWHHMKSHCGTKTEREYMQIINDLRAAYLVTYFAILMAKYGNAQNPNPLDNSLKKINDFGSDNLTSDKDFSLQVGSEYISKEAEIADEFNQLFEQDWGGPSAIVFDCNAYTMQYVLTAYDPVIETTRSKLQQEASLLMKLRTSTPEHWIDFKKGTLTLLQTSPDVKKMKEQEFEKIEQQQLQLNVILLKKAGCDFSLDRIKALPSKSEAAQEAAAEEVRKLIQNDSQCYVDASNALFVKYKKQMRQLEDRRVELVRCKKELMGFCESGDAAGFSHLFNQHLEKLIVNLQAMRRKLKNPKKIPLIDKRLQDFERSKILPGQEQDTMKAFEDRTNHEIFAQHAQNQRLHLDEILHLRQKYKILKKSIQMPTAAIKADMTKVADALEKVSRMPLQEVLSKTVAKSLQSKIARADKLIAKGRADYQANTENYMVKTKSLFWHRAGIFSIAGDRMLVEIQQKNLIGNCFMQESHSSEGACAFVIENLQAGITHLRTPNQYLQAFREISGYFSGHQSSGLNAQSKMVEVSKYAVRMLLVIEFIKDRGKAVGIQNSLKLDKDLLKKSAAFFAKLASLRKKGGDQQEIIQVVEDIASSLQLKSDGVLQDSDIRRINAKMIELSAAVEAWCAMIEHDDKQASKLNQYFKI